MKSMKEISDEIEQIESFSKIQNMKKSERKKHEKRVVFLRTALHYLETEPRIEGIENQLKHVEHEIKVLDERFEMYQRPKGYEGNLRSRYNKEFGYIKLKNQKTMLKFLLK